MDDHRKPSSRKFAVEHDAPVVCSDCCAFFGGGAELGTVCPYCAGPLHPLPDLRALLAPPEDPDRRQGP